MDTLQVRVTDSLGNSALATITINVANPIVITPMTIPNPAHAVAYSQQLAATGGTSPYTWALLASMAGTNTYSVSSSGLITATPSTAETDQFSVLVTDANGIYQSISYTVTVS